MLAIFIFFLLNELFIQYLKHSGFILSMAVMAEREQETQSFCFYRVCILIVENKKMNKKYIISKMILDGN